MNKTLAAAAGRHLSLSDRRRLAVSGNCALRQVVAGYKRRASIRLTTKLRNQCDGGNKVKVVVGGGGGFASAGEITSEGCAIAGAQDYR